MPKEIKVHVMITENDIVVSNMSTLVSGGRHEFTFNQPIKVNGREFTGFALEMWLDRESRRIAFKEYDIKPIKE